MTGTCLHLNVAVAGLKMKQDLVKPFQVVISDQVIAFRGNSSLVTAMTCYVYVLDVIS